jgi:hypothetical protein
MASLTQKRKLKRKKQLRASGKTRKRRLAPGSTPRFPVHLEENDPKAVVPQPPGSHPDEKIALS